MTERLGPIVIADAHPLERLGITSVFRQYFGSEAIEVADDFTELERFMASGVALAVIDRDLPGLISSEQIRRLRVSHLATRIVLVSAACSLDIALDALRCGAHGFVPKTLGSVDFVQAFRMIAQGLVYIPNQICDVALLKDAAREDRGAALARKLSERQSQVLRLACEGCSNKEIGRHLSISEATVKVHIGAAFRAMGVTSRARAIAAFHHYDHFPASQQPQGSVHTLMTGERAA